MAWFEDTWRRVQSDPRYAGGSSTFNEKAGAQQVDPRLSDGIPGNAGTPYTSGNTGVTGGAGQDPEAYIRSLFRGGTLTPQQLKAREAELNAHGITLLGANAEGIQSKIRLPNGQSVDLIRDAGGDNAFQYLENRGGGGGGGTLGSLGGGNLPPGYWMGQETGGGQYPLASAGGPGLAQPWTTPFKSPGDFQSPGDFKPPDVTEDPGFKFRMQEGTKALERSAAAKGTLLTGGTLKDLQNFSQGLASQEYANAYGRRLGENEQQYGRALGENQLAYGRGLGEYGMAHDIYRQNQGDLYSRLSGMAGLGGGGDAGSWANSMANTITGRGDALAQGQMNAGNAWAGGVGNLGNIGSQTYLWSQMNRQPQPFVPGWSQIPQAYPTGGYYGTPTQVSPGQL